MICLSINAEKGYYNNYPKKKIQFIALFTPESLICLSFSSFSFFLEMYKHTHIYVSVLKIDKELRRKTSSPWPYISLKRAQDPTSSLIYINLIKNKVVVCTHNFNK